MKLLAKYNRVNIFATIVVLLLSAVVYYFFIEHALTRQLDKSLVAEEKEITDYISETGQLPEPSVSKEEQEVYEPATATVSRTFSSVEIKNNHSRRRMYYRQLSFPVNVNNKTYIAYVRKSQEETEDLVQLILRTTLVIVIILLVTLFLINRFLLSKLWKPFNNTLQQMKLFNISAKNEIHFERTNINEFTELNDAVKLMAKNVINDYNEIKSFTENASHEIQTPLAIIKSKLELLSQSESLEEEDINTIQIIFETANRLSKLNQSLLLLTKLDNKQFIETEKVNISERVIFLLNNYEELLEAKHIKLATDIELSVLLNMNETLTDILITNLVVNAIKHNIDEGRIHVELKKDYLRITNTGKALLGDASMLFERFKKESASADSLGLGLSIVKKICDTYNFLATYAYTDGTHTVKVSFIKHS